MPRRPALLALGALALVAVLVVGLLQATGGGDTDRGKVPTLAQARAQLAGAPAPLAALHRRMSQVVQGTLRGELAALRGHPVVVNNWASWCAPCVTEFPVFQRVSVRLGRRVAFLGVDTKDPASSARTWLRRNPISYPSLADPRERLADELGGIGLPTTAFYDRGGEQCYLHQGQYFQDAALEADVARYTRTGCPT